MLAVMAAGAASAQSVSTPKDQPPTVDHWVLALSWSPAWCLGKAGEKDVEQCGKGKRHGFVVHGLWPQFGRGDKPKDCAAGTGVPKDVADKMMPVMPSHPLIEREWAKHGACSGLKPADYFSKTRAAYDKIKVPAAFKAPDKPAKMTVQQIEKLFGEANPGLSPEAIAVTCRKDKLADVRICMDKDLKVRDCRATVRDRCKMDAQIDPVR